MKIRFYVLFLLLFFWTCFAFAEADVAQLKASLISATVALKTFDKNHNVLKQAMGFRVGKKGLIVTDADLLTGAYFAEAKANNGQTYPVKSVVGPYNFLGLAGIMIDHPTNAGSKGLDISSVIPREDEEVFGFGAHGFHKGVIMSIHDTPTTGRFFTTTISSSPETGGGPIINMAGNVVGVGIHRLIEGQRLTIITPGRNVIDLEQVNTSTPLTEWADQAISNRANMVDDPYTKGMAFYRAGRRKKAFALFKAAKEKTPERAEIWVAISVCYAESGQYSHSEKAIKQALRIRPDDAAGHNYLGVVLVRQGRYEEGLDHFLEATGIDPGYAEAHNNMGVVYDKLDRLQESYRHFSAAVTTRPDYAQAHFNWGKALARSMLLQKACDHFVMTPL